VKKKKVEQMYIHVCMGIKPETSRIVAKSDKQFATAHPIFSIVDMTIVLMLKHL
jgi:hypothetical protein